MNRIKNILIDQTPLPVYADLFFNDEIEKKRVIIYAHGFNGFKDWGNFDLIAERFAEAGYLFIKFNFSHNGTTLETPEEFNNLEAFGQNNYTKELADLKMVVDWICSETNPYNSLIDDKHLYLIGHSMGGGIAILFASEDPRIKKLIGWAAIAECRTPWGSWPVEKLTIWKAYGVAYYLNGRTKQQMPVYYQLYEDYQTNKERLNIERAIKGLKIPMLFCHGESDPAVPVEVAFQLKKWQPGAQIFIFETDHVFGRKHPWTETNLPQATLDLVAETLNFLKD